MTSTRSAAAGEGRKPSKAPRKAARKPAAKKTAGRKPAAPRRSASEKALAERLEQLGAALADRLEAIERRLAEPPPAVSARLPGEVGARLAQALEEVPRAADFEPLAEHIYELARHAPRLLEALQTLPDAIAPFQQSVQALEQTVETLQYVHESFSESLLRLPRAEDYEPLVTPLTEFARVAPALAESLSDVLRITAPLGQSLAGLRRVTDELAATQRALVGSGTAPGPAPDAGALLAVAEEIDAARRALRTALASLPRDPEYKKVADQLREIASVSPSLLDWMQQVTPLSRPLGESVGALREAVERLDASHARLLAALHGPRGEPGD